MITAIPAGRNVYEYVNEVAEETRRKSNDAIAQRDQMKRDERVERKSRVEQISAKLNDPKIQKNPTLVTALEEELDKVME